MNIQLQRISGRVGLVLVILLSLWAGGCVRTTQPILQDDQVVPDDALLGKWISSDGRVSGELVAAANNHYKLAYTDEEGKTGHFLVRFGKIDDLLVAELSADVPVADTSEEFRSLLMPLYSMVVIQKTQPQLVLTTAPSPDWFKKYIAAHPDELEVTAADASVVQSSTEEFQTFFTRHYKEDGMLGDPATFVRPGDPSTQPAMAK